MIILMNSLCNIKAFGIKYKIHNGTIHIVHERGMLNMMMVDKNKTKRSNNNNRDDDVNISAMKSVHECKQECLHLLYEAAPY